MRENEYNSGSDMEFLSDGQYVKIRLICSGCGRVNWTKRVPANKPYSAKNIKCKCGITGFNWEYKPLEINGKYAYFNSSASVSASQLPRLIRRNDHHFRISNQ
jgi:hypothetical protein